MVMVDAIKESGMSFITDNAFYIEKSPLYTNLGESIRSVEFVRVKNEDLLLVEAKTTFPNPENPSEENLIKFRTGIEDICNKFIHSLNLLSSIEIGLAGDVYGDEFNLPDKVALVFILVIKNHKKEWCKKVNEAFIEALPDYLKKIWKPTVYVINLETAINMNIVMADCLH